ncbi:hypothetical protein K402DRAFT_371161 [Aulographum hederae CBS 113979]|uniref:Uncharacterized protein n=1 Tax=Aulographum hederae CBS 113979 TaxID=1176131 RepID=A0A6G1HAF9_9PEZI|nr:hypothetical protein K402DRAFT_371161 [Aulographum hederae CBS 113979]
MDGSGNGTSTNVVHVNGSLTNGVSHPISNGDSKIPLHRPIAVCGMALRLPGGLHSPQQLWDFLISKGDARCRVPKSRYNIDAYYSDTAKPGSIKTEYGYFLDESINLGSLDASFFTIPRGELERTDPHQRQMLEVARECLEDAGETNWKGKRIGCFMGSFGEDWCEMFAKEPQQHGLYRVSGYGDFMLSNRVSYEMDLQGPSMTFRTGCSAALVALNAACQAIQRGDCESALVGGANLILAPGMTTAMTEQGVLSPEGSCKTFSAEADGYARGEAINAVFVKPLEDAVRDGNPIRSVIRSTSSNNDGRTPGISCPSTDSHEAMIRNAYKMAGLEYAQTAFVECHGTGTSTGDPIEANAVARVFGDSGVYIGSVKPNLGHSEGASGLTSLIKVILALENQTIPPNIKFSTPNPNIPFKTRKLTVPVEPTPWPKDRSERVSVNSFGIGGSNAHAVLDSARSFGIEPCVRARPQIEDAIHDEPQLLLYSANSADSLKKMVANYGEYVEKNPDCIDDLAYTLANRREHLPHRTFAVASKSKLGSSAPVVRAGTQSPNLVMVFTGQGAQWPQMGAELMRTNDVFRNSILSLDKDLQQDPDAPPEWSIEKELLKPAKTSRLHTAEISQPLCTAIQIALVDALRAIGITPTAVVGHSSGEVAAAYAAGALTAREAITTASHRGFVTKRQMRQGGMAAIGMGWGDVENFLVPTVTVACENSPSSVTLSGDRERLEEVVAEIQKQHPDKLARVLKVDQAYHSYHMVEVGEDYHSLIKDKVIGKDPKVLYFSSVTGDLLKHDESLGARYWQKNLESPVLFRTALASMLKHPVSDQAVFLEVGPHSALAGPLKQTLAQGGNSSPYVSALLRNQNSIECFLTAIGKLHQLNVPMDLSAVVPKGHTLADLPRYPWNHDSVYWYESRLSKEWRLREHPYHDILGVKLPESTELAPVWRNILHLDNAGWIRDHKIKDDIVFPFAGYAAMCGEAVRQISGIEEGFTLNHVVVSTALVVAENRPVEIMTSLRRHKYTDSLDSAWWDFTIASHNGETWTKHCTGLVKPVSEIPDAEEAPAAFARKIESPKWYATMRNVGLNYGSQFQGLEQITASTTEQFATARALETTQKDKKKYHLHPTITDFSLQLLSVAVTQGLSRRLATMVVPTNIEELSVYRTYADVDMSVSAISTAKGAICGGGKVTANGKLALSISGVRLSPLAEAEPSETNTHATARMEWAPHVDFLDASKLIKPAIDRSLYTPRLDQLTRLGLVHSKRQIEGVQTTREHLDVFRGWIDRQIVAHGCTEELQLTDDEIVSEFMNVMGNLEGTPAAIGATAMYKVLINCQAIFKGEKEALEVLLSDGTLTELYNFTDEVNRSALVQHLAHSKPNLRVLEIGAGTGASTERIQQDLVLPDGRILFSKYTFTDISSGFFVAAKERFKDVPNMEYAMLDISKDPAKQGIELGQYDLILATNVLHATQSLNETLTNVRKLLAPEGRLLLHEIYSTSKWINYIFGTLPGWWLGAPDGRPDEPYVSPERWQKEFVAAGFRGIDALALDSEEPHQLNAIMIAKPETGKSRTKAVAILSDDNKGLPNAIVDLLKKRGYEVSGCSLDDTPPTGTDIISLLDADKPFFENITAERLDSFKTFVNNLGGSGLLWITGLSQMHCTDPRYGQIIGTARSIRSELSADFGVCEVDDFNSDRIVDVFETFHMRAEDEILQPDFEYAIKDGVVNVGRYHPFPIHEELLSSDASDKVILDIENRGRLNTLHWVKAPTRSLKGDEIDVETYSVGLNFRDVLGALGIMELSKSDLGLEATGIVKRVGPETKDIKVGDRVFMISGGSFSTQITCSEKMCARIPQTLSFDDGATMPCVYATALYSLDNVARLKKGQTILIHSACGGVGISAIQLAKMMGAEIYVTVGNEEKVQYLMKTFDIPRHRIFNSRNTSFYDDLMRETNGVGVDVLLNSLSGELLHASWKCIAEFGMMVEIGKRDLIGAGKLDMETFLLNRTYACVDLDKICQKRPTVCNELLKSVVKYFEEGHIQPIRPTKVFGANVISDAFRYMQQGIHMGKIVVSIRQNALETKLESEGAQREKTLELSPSASYLLVGGLGGLGKAISTWMVENNARHLIYLSRSAGSSAEDQAFVRELESMSCTVSLIRGSVSNLSDVQRAVSASPHPLKGILQMSMVLRDQAFPRMSIEEWNTTVDPKVRGTWNLHNASQAAGLNLDFFVLFSSISGVIGQPGQANYGGANTFLDAFVQFRAAAGLPASVVDIGAVEDVGYIAHTEALLKRMKTTSAFGIREKELLNALTVAMTPFSAPKQDPRNVVEKFVARNHFVLGLGSTTPLRDVANRSIWKKDRRMAVYHNTLTSSTTSSSAGSNDALKTFLNSAKTDPALLTAPSTATFLAREIGKKLFDFLLKSEEDLDTSLSLADLGMDSLVAIEMRSWWKVVFGFDISVLEMLGKGTLEALGRCAAEGVARGVVGEGGGSGGEGEVGGK